MPGLLLLFRLIILVEGVRGGGKLVEEGRLVGEGGLVGEGKLIRALEVLKLVCLTRIGLALGQGSVHDLSYRGRSIPRASLWLWLRSMPRMQAVRL